MEEVIIKDKSTTITLYLNKESFYGYKYDNNKITTIDISVFNYFTLFKLSNDNTKIGKYNQYEIYIDNKTGLKHYLNNDIDDFEMIFQNNGNLPILYKNNQDNLENRKYISKAFIFADIIIVCTCASIIFANTVLANSDSIKNIYPKNVFYYEILDNFELEDIQNLIYSSINLTEEEKDYLYNPDFLKDVLNTINNSNYLKHKLKEALTNIKITSFTTSDNNKKTNGYYTLLMPNTIHIKNYEGLNSQNKDTLSHEFIHLCQDTYGYSLIIEASAEIISNEYYQSTEIDSYIKQVKVLKILMEIIGPEPIWYYNFTGDFSKIEEKVKPYLTKKEYREFLRDLSYSYTDDKLNEKRLSSLENLLDTLYKNIYNDDISENEIITLIKNNTSMTRYYFNHNLINIENSYYIGSRIYDYKEMSYKEAVDNGIIKIYAIRNRKLNKEEATEYLKNPEIVLKREIDYTNNTIEIIDKYDSNNKTYITGTINGKYYENEDIDELFLSGYINIDYSVDEYKLLTYEEFISDENKDYETHFSYDHNIILNDNTISVPLYYTGKIYLPPINIENNNSTMKK